MIPSWMPQIGMKFKLEGGGEMAAPQDQIPLEPITRTNEKEFQEFGCIPSYTQLLMVFNFV